MTDRSTADLAALLRKKAKEAASAVSTRRGGDYERGLRDAYADASRMVRAALRLRAAARPADEGLRALYVRVADAYDRHTEGRLGPTMVSVVLDDVLKTLAALAANPVVVNGLSFDPDAWKPE